MSKIDVSCCETTIKSNYSLGEEIFNAVSHGIGSVLSFFAFFLLINRLDHTIKNYVCISVYCLSLFCLYTISTLYHSLTPGKAKNVFQKLDHCSIFILIAGTYMPICLIFVGGIMSKIVFAIVCSAAICGIVLNAVNVQKFSKFSMVCYIVMGWSVLFMAKPTFRCLDVDQLCWLIEG
ncbi:MAG: hemolysin III family protein, partial [Clostridia bacterium]|nr:hemolysin III family protein [Clostridia bacterium]MBR2734773.1 hemolysin III family protein [Clostridia bacterium]